MPTTLTANGVLKDLVKKGHSLKGKFEGKMHPRKALKDQRESRSIALLFL